jgi:hypothetical protein
MASTGRDTVVYRPTKGHKAILAFVGAIVMWLTAAFGDDALNLGEVGEGVTLLVEAAVTAIAVYVKRNPPATE